MRRNNENLESQIEEQNEMWNANYKAQQVLES
jgi:hypothetical protein